ncbi:peptidoglycan DD-metalloendopeptidase family protein [Candidatus Falkowbacteria bacterium]|nr:peptidoglycan DD-metalloendopeptidase family protein [Candidatus Falkowbacteria bacterium]
MNKDLASLLIFVLLFQPGFVFAQDSLTGPYANHPDVIELTSEIKDKESELKNLEKATKAYQQKIEEARRQSVSLQTQLLLIDNQITKVELDIKTSQLTLDKTQLEIDAIQTVIQKEEEEIQSQKDRLAEYIVMLNKQGKRSALEILLLNRSFSEFFSELNSLEQIQADIKNSIDRVQLLKENLEVQKQQLVSYKDSLQNLKDELEGRQMRLQEQQTAKESILYDTKRSEVTYQRLLTEAKDVQKEVDASITNIKDEIKKKITRLRSGSTDPKTTFVVWPVESKGITTYFNDPDYPYRYLFEHSAIDIRAPQGSDLVAPADGYVARARNNGYGYSYITLIHDNGLSTVFGHVNKILVQADQFVKAGDVIGKSGGKPGTLGAGNFTTGPHLHFETRLNGIPVDPLLYLP